MEYRQRHCRYFPLHLFRRLYYTVVRTEHIQRYNIRLIDKIISQTLRKPYQYKFLKNNQGIAPKVKRIRRLLWFHFFVMYFILTTDIRRFQVVKKRMVLRIPFL